MLATTHYSKVKKYDFVLLGGGNFFIHFKLSMDNRDSALPPITFPDPPST